VTSKSEHKKAQKNIDAKDVNLIMGAEKGYQVGLGGWGTAKKDVMVE